MNDIRTYFDYFSTSYGMNHRLALIAISGNLETGPAILHHEDNRYNKLLQRRDFMQNYALYSMMATTQGNYYHDEVCILPVARFSDYQGLITAVLLPGDGPVHERYFQVIIFIPVVEMDMIQMNSHLRSELIQLVKSSKIMRTGEYQDMIRLKFDILQMLSKNIYSKII